MSPFQFRLSAQLFLGVPARPVAYKGEWRNPSSLTLAHPPDDTSIRNRARQRLELLDHPR